MDQAKGSMNILAASGPQGTSWDKEPGALKGDPVVPPPFLEIFSTASSCSLCPKSG